MNDGLGFLVLFGLVWLAWFTYFAIDEAWYAYQHHPKRRVKAIFKKAHKDMERVRREQAT